MNRHLALTGLLILSLSACHSRSQAPVQEASPAAPEQPGEQAQVQSRNLQRTIEAEGFSSKGTIQAITEVPVYSRIAEQIVGFDIVLGQPIRKGEVVVRLSQDILKDRIARSKADLEKAEFQYQSILMGQGYKRNELDKAPEDIRRQARVSTPSNSRKKPI